MTAFGALSPGWRGLYLLWDLLTAYLLVYILISRVQLRRPPGQILSTGAMALTAALLVALGSHNGGVLRYVPAPVMAGLLLGLTAAALRQLLRLARWRRYEISPMSIKESFDSLPMGLCCYWPEGMTKLVNNRMDQLSRALTGSTVRDPQALWDRLVRGALPGSVQGGDNPIVHLPDGTAWSFSRNKIALEGQPLYEILAADVSREYRLNRELAEKKGKAAWLNARLRALSGSIKFMVMDREALQAKVRIHDSLGQSLLLTRRSLLEPGEVESAELVRAWRFVVDLLKREGPELWHEPYFTSRERAKALGVELTIDGDLPYARHLRPVVETALTTHVTNVLRHAHGAHAYVAVREGEESWTLRLTNDGDPPAGPIREGGGLGNLRRETELLGGTMRVDYAPAFQLTLILPKEEPQDGLPSFDRG